MLDVNSYIATLSDDSPKKLAVKLALMIPPRATQLPPVMTPPQGMLPNQPMAAAPMTQGRGRPAGSSTMPGSGPIAQTGVPGQSSAVADLGGQTSTQSTKGFGNTPTHSGKGTGAAPSAKAANALMGYGQSAMKMPPIHAPTMAGMGNMAQPKMTTPSISSMPVSMPTGMGLKAAKISVQRNSNIKKADAPFNDVANWPSPEDYLKTAPISAGLNAIGGAAIGAPLGMVAGHARGDTFEGLRRGSIRGGITGAGAGLGSNLGAAAGAATGSNLATILGSLLGGAAGGIGSWHLSGKALGTPKGNHNETDMAKAKEKQHEDKKASDLPENNAPLPPKPAAPQPNIPALPDPRWKPQLPNVNQLIPKLIPRQRTPAVPPGVAKPLR